MTRSRPDQRQSPRPADRPRLSLGEVHTGLLQSSSAISAPVCRQVLALLLGERVRSSERPIAYAASPELLTGLDCRMPSRSGARTRGVGTALSRTSITGGHVLQSSTVVQVERSEQDRRLAWSHYLARPGTVETIGKANHEDMIAGFAATEANGNSLDLGSINGRIMHTVQQSPALDRKPPFRIARTRLRWAAVHGNDSGAGTVPLRFTIESDDLRTVRLQVADADVTSLAELCEDLALHDWLLTTLLTIIERSRIGADAPTRAVNRLRPAIDHILHLWMPAARLDRAIAELWQGLEHRPGFSRQWQAGVARIRDQIAVGAIAMLSAAAGQGAGPA